LHTIGGIRSRVFIDVEIDGKPAGRIEIILFDDVAPRSAENFRKLCTGEGGVGASGKRLHYKGSKLFHMSPNGLLLKGGDIVNNDGTGGDSIHGLRFPDEDFSRKHVKYSISTDHDVTHGSLKDIPDSNSSRFIICAMKDTDKEPKSLDGNSVVFGEIIRGFKVLEKITHVGASKDGVPKKEIKVIDCGKF